MKTYKQDELNEIIKQHNAWIKDNLLGKWADLSGANLSKVSLSGANLSGANFSRANFSRADLSRADLSGANFSRANFSRADLSRADLSGANLSEANLSRADLSRADLSRADLSGANLYGADLSGANLSKVSLSEANLSRADLSGANLARADLSMFKIIPQGKLKVYKKLQNNVIVILEIPEKAKRVNAYGSRKCRAEYGKVLKILDGEKEILQGIGIRNKIIYKKGKIVRPDGYNDDPRIECSNGIHFFITEEEARNYHG